MEFDDTTKKPALLLDIIPAEMFYDCYNPDQIIIINHESLDQINLANFDQLIENIQEFLQDNRDLAFTFDLLKNRMQLEMPENQRLMHIEILRRMVSDGHINGYQIKGKFYLCFPKNNI